MVSQVVVPVPVASQEVILVPETLCSCEVISIPVTSQVVVVTDVFLTSSSKFSSKLILVVNQSVQFSDFFCNLPKHFTAEILFIFFFHYFNLLSLVELVDHSGISQKNLISTFRTGGLAVKPTVGRVTY